MAEPMRKDGVGSRFGHWQWVALGLFMFLACFGLLGKHGLLEPDEGRYAEMSREMLAGANWLVPTLHGAAHPQKPPIIYWLTAGAMACFGPSEWAVRLPSAFAALGTGWLTYVIGRRLFGVRAGIAAMIMLLTSVQFFILARMITPDMALTFWITAALAAFVRWDTTPAPRVSSSSRRQEAHSVPTRRSEQRSEPRYLGCYVRLGSNRWLWAFFALMGLGFLTKGPMAIVVPVSAALTWQIAHRRQGSRVRIPWIRGMLLTLALGLSWFVVVAAREPQLFYFFAHDELFARVATTHHGRYRSPLFFIPVLLIGLLPWTLLLPSLIRWQVVEWKRNAGLDPTWWLLLGWVAWPFLLLSLSGSKLMTYVLPLYPAWALALGAWWDRVGAQRDLSWPMTALVAFIGLLSFALAGITFWTSKVVSPLSLPVFLGLMVVALGLGAVLISPRTSPAVLGSAAAAGTLSAFLLLISRVDACHDLLGPGASMRSLAGHLQTGSPIVFQYGVNAPGLEFYLNRLVYISKGQMDHLVPATQAQAERLLDSPEQCALLARRGPPVLGVVKFQHLGRDFPTNTWRLIEKTGDFALIQARDTLVDGSRSNGVQASTKPAH